MPNVLRFRSVLYKTRPRVVRVVDASGNFLGRDTQGSIITYDLSSVREHTIRLTIGHRLLVCVLSFWLWVPLSILLAIWAGSWLFVLFIAALFAALSVFRHILLSRRLYEQMSTEAISKRKGDDITNLEIVREEEWTDWSKSHGE